MLSQVFIPTNKVGFFHRFTVLFAIYNSNVDLFLRDDNIKVDLGDRLAHGFDKLAVDDASVLVNKAFTGILHYLLCLW